MLRAGVPRATAHLVNLGFALMIPLGAVAFVVGLRGLGAEAAGAITADSLAFSAGTFLCIALSDLLPELQFHEHDRVKLSAALLAGVGLMAVAGGSSRTTIRPRPRRRQDRSNRENRRIESPPPRDRSINPPDGPRRRNRRRHASPQRTMGEYRTMERHRLRRRVAGISLAAGALAL